MAYPNNIRVMWFMKDFATGSRVFGGYGKIASRNPNQSYVLFNKIYVICDNGLYRAVDSDDVVLATKWHIKHKDVIKGSRLPHNSF